MEVPEGLGLPGFLYFLRHLWFLVDPVGLWTLEVPFFLDVPVDLRGLGFPAFLRRLCPLVVPLNLVDRVVPRCPWIPRVLGSREYLVYLGRQKEHHNHKVHMVEMGECPVSKKKKTNKNKKQKTKNKNMHW